MTAYASTPSRVPEAAGWAPGDAPDHPVGPGLARLRAFLAITTVWHPTGALPSSGGIAY